MKKNVISVNKLKEAFDSEFFAYPVKSIPTWEGISEREGFYMGIHPVFDQGYGIDYNGEYFRMQDDKMDNKLKVGLKEKETLLLPNESWISWEGEYFLAPHTTTSWLKKFGFTEEEIERAKVTIHIPVKKEIEFSEEELEILIGSLQKSNAPEELIQKVVNKHQSSYPLWILRSYLEKEA